jgi:hypothetical protein
MRICPRDDAADAVDSARTKWRWRDSGKPLRGRQTIRPDRLASPAVSLSTARVSPIPLIHAALQRLLRPCDAQSNGDPVDVWRCHLFAPGLSSCALTALFFLLCFVFCFFFSVCVFSFSSKRNEDEEASEKLYCHVTHVNVPTFKGLSTVAVKDE